MTQYTSEDGLVWENGGAATDDHLAFGGHERFLGPILASRSDSAKTYINVGAHVGTWALRMAKFNQSVWAVEGNKKTFDTLNKNIAANNLQDKVHAINAVVWDDNKTKVTMVDVNDKDTGGSTRAVETDSGSLTHTLDSLFLWETDSPVGLISTDVEGAEARVLRGAKDLIARDRPNLVIELHEGHPGTDADLRQQVYDVLTELNYTYESFFNNSWEEYILGTPAEVPQNEPEIVKAGE